jgi:hypothetical protein
MKKIKLTVYAYKFMEKDIECIPYSDFDINFLLKTGSIIIIIM